MLDSSVLLLGRIGRLLIHVSSFKLVISIGYILNQFLVWIVQTFFQDLNGRSKKKRFEFLYLSADQPLVISTFVSQSDGDYIA